MNQSSLSSTTSRGRTFKKRSATTEKGRSYEDFMTAAITLDLLRDDNLQDFAVWSNDEQFGAFDDVIVEMQPKDKDFEKYALQLKHIGQSNQLSLKSLSATSGNFAINKYFHSFQTCKEALSGYNLILLTNLRFKLYKNVQIQMKDAEGKPFQVKIISAHAHPKLNTDMNSTECYKFQIVEDTNTSIALEEYKIFFEKFFLYTNQTNVENMKSRIFKLMKEYLHSDDSITDKYLKYITNWSSQEGTKSKLHKKMVQKVITLSLISPFIRPLSFDGLSENGKILQQAISKFDITIFHEDSTNDIKKLFGDSRDDLDETKIKMLNRFYQISSEKNDNIQNLSDTEWSMLLWLMGKCPLIIQECSEMYKAIDLSRDRDFILILADMTSSLRLLQGYSIFRKLSDLKSYDIFSELSKNFKILFLGQQVNLEYLLSQNKNIQHNITTDELLKMTTNLYEVTQPQEEIVTPYVSRLLSKNTFDIEYLDKVDNGTVVVISNVASIEDFNLFKKYKPIYVDEYMIENQSSKQTVEETMFLPRLKIFISKKLCSQEEFDCICSKNKMMQTFHHFSISDGSLEWLKAQKTTDIFKLEQFRLKTTFLKEKELLRMDSENYIHIVTGDPGMGKSCLLTNLKNMLSSKIWTILFTPQDITNICDFLRFHKNNIDNIEDFIVKMKYPHLTDFDKDLIKLLLSKSKVVYLWDALDELVCDDSLDILTRLIKKFSEVKIVQWITCRLHLKKGLERRFNVFSRTIIPFSKEEQSYYIRERLKHLLTDPNLLEDVTHKILNNIGLLHCQDILGIPLQIYMLTELFRKDIQTYSALLEEQFLLTDLYKYFIDEKFIFFYKDKIKFDDFQARRLRQTQKNHLRIFEVAALRMLLDDDIFNLLRIDCNFILEEVMTDGDCFGFLNQTSANDIAKHISFSHISYAEYLVAVYISKHVEDIQKEMKSILFREKFTNVRYFFDMLLAQNSPAHIAVLHKNLPQVRSYEEEIQHKDLGGRSVLQIASSWGTRYKIMKCEKGDTGYTLEHEPSSVTHESVDYLDTIDYLLEKCNFDESDELHGMNAVDYALETQCLLVLAVFEDKYKFGYFTSEDDGLNCSTLYYAVVSNLKTLLPLFQKYLKCLKTERGDTLLHIASRIGHHEIAAVLLSFGVDVNACDQFGSTSLHQACFQGHKNVVEVLMKSGANLYSANILNEATPFHVASERGDKEIVELFLALGANVDIPDRIKKTPLHVACQNGHQAIVKTLVDYGADFNLISGDGLTPLHWACVNGYVDIIQYLINVGSSVNVIDRSNDTSLFHACQNGHTECVELLIKLETHHVNIADKYTGWTPLHVASKHGYTNIVKLLLQYGANPNIPDSEKETPILAAAKNGHHEIVSLLLKHGVDVNIKNVDRWTPLYAACNNGHFNVAKLLIDHGANIAVSPNENYIPLIAAAGNGHEKIVDLLITSGAETDVYFGAATPLSTACAFGHEKVVDLLIKSGVDIQKCGIAVHQAAEQGYFKVIETLIRHGYDINSPDTDGNTVLHMAAKEGQQRAVENLIKCGSDVNLPNNLGMSALHFAAREGRVEAVKSLVNNEAVIDQRDAYGTTPLILSCIWGKTDAAELLILASANINMFDNNGLSPLGAAFHNRHEEVVDLLVASGAHPVDVDGVTSTPLYVFCELGDLRSVVCCGFLMRVRLETTVYNGWRAIHIACFRGYEEIVKQLLNLHADVNARTSAGETPVELARQNGHTRIVRIIESYTPNKILL